MRFVILSLFPGYFYGPFNETMIGRAKESGLIEIDLVDIRDFAEGKHRRVDDRPYGGGPGMVMMPGPVTQAIRNVRTPKSHVIYFSPQGSPLTAAKCKELAEHEELILLCGHYEGVDQRAIDAEIDEEISIGDYVLSNGCAAAIVCVDAVSRFIPGFLGHEEAAAQDTFEEGRFDWPHYTRPEEFEGNRVPEVLLSGNHQKIEAWRRAQALQKTERVRPDLVNKNVTAE